MNFISFKKQLILNIENENKKCVSFIDENKKLISEYLNDENNLTSIKEFINELYPIILKAKKFTVIESVLKHPLFVKVLFEFRKSNVLIKACQDKLNKKALEWLLSMDISPSVQDEHEKTALMYAVQDKNLEFVVDALLKKREDFIHMADCDGNTALFYSGDNISATKKLLALNMNYNEINKDHDSVLMYWSKNSNLSSFDLLINKSDINVNISNNVGKNLAMLLVENAQYKEFKILVDKKSIDINYKNKFDETILSVFLRKYYQKWSDDSIRGMNNKYAMYLIFKKYSKTLKTLIDMGCDFNGVIDGDGNTPILFFLLIHDYYPAHYLIKNCPSIDLSVKNKYGINATFLSLDNHKEIKDSLDKQFYEEFKFSFLSNSTFDFSYLDEFNNNLLILAMIKESPLTSYISLHIDKEILTRTNNKQENAIIIATKLGDYHVLLNIIKQYSWDINHADSLGNTAIYYAVKIKDKRIINLLMSQKADPTIKNKEGLSAKDIAKEADDPRLLELIENPLTLAEIEKQQRKNKNKKSSDEKLNQYIKNYQVTNYRKEYENYINSQASSLSYYVPFPNREEYKRFNIEVFFPGVLFEQENTESMPVVQIINWFKKNKSKQ